jgi:hypothetical protein
VIHSRVLVTLVTAGAIVVALSLRSFASEAAASRATDEISAADTTVAGELNLDVAESITFNLTVTNNTSKRVELRFPSGQTHDFVVLDSLGREVWKWSSGKMFTQVLRNRTLDSRTSISFTESWKKPVLAGTYTAVARLWSRNYPIEQRVQFVISGQN